MLRYATTRLRGKALRWHAKLDPSVWKDWGLFVQALFEEYPFVEKQDRDEIATPVWTSTTFSPPFSTTTLSGTPASHVVSSADASQLPAAVNEAYPPTRTQVTHSYASICSGSPARSPVVYDPSVPGPHIGRLRIIYQEGRPRPQYVRCSCEAGEELKNATLNAEEALIVSFVPFSEPHEILCMNPRNQYRRKLAVKLFRGDVAEYHPIVGSSIHSSPTTAESSNLTYESLRFQRVSKVWNILADGTLQVTLAELSLEKIGKYTYRTTPADAYFTTTVHVDISGQTISFTKDHGTPRLLHPDSRSPIVRARIVFEPL
ncbi:hypothetical protein M407DRAFT_33938 [Tulasnella calospora MUT 4182]|uniref:Uncharacterized protein n=1 Tax=Tulasnella calospora MUT 4182 TaxID=1051891 RepID=A0A0C3Q1H6_9AGAM|nr:hypothetical protein M407DRAFT_33938 [Tulasnella calospora MUT 4182]